MWNLRKNGLMQGGEYIHIGTFPNEFVKMEITAQQ